MSDNKRNKRYAQLVCKVGFSVQVHKNQFICKMMVNRPFRAT